jgi:hypothetical protein
LTSVVVGRAVVDCTCCPWPVHLALVTDPDRVDADGLLPALDAVQAGVPRALRVHYKQHFAEDDDE